LTLDAKTTVIISGEIGLQSRIGDLVVVADNIYINNDIHTAVTQTYTINRNINGGYAGSVYIGDVDQSTRSTLFNEKVNATWIDTDGYTSQKADIKEVKNASESRVVRVLTSEDPNITFDGPVNDTIENTHSLVVLAITNIQNPTGNAVPIVRFVAPVGLEKQLYGLTARSLYAASVNPEPVISGMVIIGGDVKTFANQTFGAAEIELTSPGTTTLYSQSGRVKMETNSYAMIGNLKLDYSAANRPEISSAPGLKRTTDTVRDAPTDMGAGSLIVGFKRGSLLEMMQNDDSDIVADVVVGDLEKSDNQSTDTLCDITKDENCPVN
jgi:hypothetical protein